jgi:hypothetical protein
MNRWRWKEFFKRTISFNEALGVEESAGVEDSEGSGLPRERTRSCISVQVSSRENSLTSRPYRQGAFAHSQTLQRLHCSRKLSLWCSQLKLRFESWVRRQTTKERRASEEMYSKPYELVARGKGRGEWITRRETRVGRRAETGELELLYFMIASTSIAVTWRRFEPLTVKSDLHERSSLLKQT